MPCHVYGFVALGAGTVTAAAGDNHLLLLLLFCFYF